MFGPLLGKINIKRLALTIVAVFVFIFASDFIIHGMLLSQSYKDTASLWRPEQDMHSYMCWMLLSQFLIAKFFSIIFARGYENKGINEGIRFGVLMGPFAVAGSFMQYAVYPLPLSIVCAWVVSGLIQMILAGVVAALVYRIKF